MVAEWVSVVIVVQGVDGVGVVCAVGGCRGERCVTFVFFLMIRRPPRSTQSRSSAASDVYKRQIQCFKKQFPVVIAQIDSLAAIPTCSHMVHCPGIPVSYTHLRAHETVLDLVCRLLLEKKKQTTTRHTQHYITK